MQLLLKWIFMLNKRLYKKPTFIAILLLIPLCVTTFGVIARQESGFLHVVLAKTDNNDEISSLIVDKLISENSIISFTYATSPEEAVSMVKNGKADEAWIFPADMATVLKNSFNDNTVSIVSREQTVFLRIAHEKLSSAIYEYYSKAFYINFIKTNFSQLDYLTNEELLCYFNNVNINEELFIIGNPGIEDKQEVEASFNYLVSPIRGILGVLTVLSGMAATLLFIRDESIGTFSWLSKKKLPAVSFGCIILSVFNTSAVIVLSLTMSGLSDFIFKEILIAMLYSVCCTAFCLLIKLLIKDIHIYSAILPLFIVAMIAICPIFFDFRSILAIQMIFPPTYFVNAVFDSNYIIYMVLYTLICLFISFIILKINIKSKKVSFSQ